MRRIGVLVAVALLISACGADDAAEDNEGTPEAAAASTTPYGPETNPVLPVTVAGLDGTEVTVESVDRIVPVNGDLAEVVWALGLGDHVVATDISATYPVEANSTPKIGYQRALVAETIVSFDPTVVLADDLAGPPEVLQQLTDAGIPVVLVASDKTIDGPAAKIAAVASALGVPVRGDALIAALRADLDAGRAAAEAGVARGGRPKVAALYLRGTSVQIVFGKGSGVDAVIEAAGGSDVGTEMGIVDNGPITAEALIEAAPDYLLVTTSGLESVGGIDGLLQISGLERTPAGLDRRVIALEDQYLYGLGPRTGQLVVELAAALHPT